MLGLDDIVASSALAVRYVTSRHVLRGSTRPGVPKRKEDITQINQGLPNPQTYLQYSRGDNPVHCLKARVNDRGSEKPTISATL